MRRHFCFSNEKREKRTRRIKKFTKATSLGKCRQTPRYHEGLGETLPMSPRKGLFSRGGALTRCPEGMGFSNFLVHTLHTHQ